MHGVWSMKSPQVFLKIQSINRSINMKLAIIATLASSAAAFSVNPQKAAQAAAVSAAVIAGAAGPAMAADIENGEIIFNGNCSACHVGGQNVIMPEKTLEKEAISAYLAGGFSEAAVMNQVTNGKGAMPAFGGRLEESQIADVAAFVINSANEGWE